MDRLHPLSLKRDSDCQASLLVEPISLFPITGNLSLRPRQGRGIGDLVRPGESSFVRDSKGPTHAKLYS
jgi:hypothetical protein